MPTPKIDISKLPVGVYADGSIVTVNFSSRNMLCQGQPRSGKSVLLATLVCSLLRADPQPLVAIISPKILDFQNFDGAARLLVDPDEMMEYLEWVERECQKRKKVCIDRGIKKIDESMWREFPPIITIVDEYAIVATSTSNEEGARPGQLGSQIDEKINRLVAEMGFAACSFCLTSQRFTAHNINSTLRENISGIRMSFATNGGATDVMVFGDQAPDAPCCDIKRSQVGCGYVSIDGLKPRVFKGAKAGDEDERAAAAYYLELKARYGELGFEHPQLVDHRARAAERAAAADEDDGGSSKGKRGRGARGGRRPR